MRCEERISQLRAFTIIQRGWQIKGGVGAPKTEGDWARRPQVPFPEEIPQARGVGLEVPIASSPGLHWRLWAGPFSRRKSLSGQEMGFCSQPERPKRARPPLQGVWSPPE